MKKIIVITVLICMVATSLCFADEIRVRGEGNGGAIYNEGSVELTDSDTFKKLNDDDASAGGAIYNRGSLELDNVNVYNEPVNEPAGGIVGTVDNDNFYFDVDEATNPISGTHMPFPRGLKLEDTDQVITFGPNNTGTIYTKDSSTTIYGSAGGPLNIYVNNNNTKTSDLEGLLIPYKTGNMPTGNMPTGNSIDSTYYVTKMEFTETSESPAAVEPVAMRPAGQIVSDYISNDGMWVRSMDNMDAIKRNGPDMMFEGNHAKVTTSNDSIWRGQPLGIY